MRELGSNAAQTLLDIINDKVDTPVQRFLDVELIERETT